MDPLKCKHWKGGIHVETIDQSFMRFAAGWHSVAAKEDTHYRELVVFAIPRLISGETNYELIQKIEELISHE